jgi:signal transduction histidine kinase
MKHLYERFSSGIGGTGLGLPISRELAIQMGGNLEISSKVGNGTTVWVIIPCELLTMERKIEDFMTS